MLTWIFLEPAGPPRIVRITKHCVDSLLTLTRSPEASAVDEPDRARDAPGSSYVAARGQRWLR